MAESDEATSDAQAIIKAVERFNGVKLVKLADGTEIAAVPNGDGGYELESVKSYIDDYRTAPERLKGTAHLETVESFIEYMKTFSGLESKIFATVGAGSGPVLIGVIDHHTKGNPRFCEHRARYAFPLSDEWISWKEKNGKWMPQAAFAEFVLERFLDFASPEAAGPAITDFAAELEVTLATPARMLDLSKGLSVRVNASASQRLNLNSGESSLNYSETHADDDGQPLKVPGGFVIGIPVFRDDVPHVMGAHLRYRVAERKVQWSYALHNVDANFKDAFREACGLVAKATALPLLYGTPET